MTLLRNSTEKLEMNKPLMMLCGLSKKLTVIEKSHSEIKKFLMVLLLSKELKLIMLPALTLSEELKLISKLT